jgi:hypothetical protein
MNRERYFKQLVQEQSDKIKELEADYNDEFTKGVLKTKEIEKLRNIIRFIQRGMDGNEQFLQVVNDLKGGIE